MHISRAGLKLIEEFEGWSSGPYWDPYGRVWTRGYGETEGIGPHSRHLTRGQGETNLRRLIERRYEWAIADLGVALNQNQWDALCSFVWNLGAGIFTGGLRTALLRREWGAAATRMLQYDHAGGVILEGLRRRRKLEADLFLRPIAEIGWRPPDEIRWEEQYDQLLHSRSPWAWARRQVLRHYMHRRAVEIVKVAGIDDWDERNRKARLQALMARTR
jgi:lysozyme